MVQLYLGPLDFSTEKLNDLEKASKQSVIAILKKIRGRIGFYPLYNLLDSHKIAEQNIAKNRGFNDKISV